MSATDSRRDVRVVPDSESTAPKSARPYQHVRAINPSTRRLRVASRHGGRLLLYAVVVSGAVIFALPFIWMVSTSFKPDGQVFSYPPVWIPNPPTTEAYTEPWTYLPFRRFYLNTAVITGLNIVGLLFACSLSAFAFARMRFPGRNILFVIVLATMMLPEQVTLIPIYVGWRNLGDLLGTSFFNTPVPLTVPSFFAANYAGAFGIFLLRQYMMTIPFDYDDAARIDGAGWFQIYSRIILPQAAPALGVIAIFAFSWNWNAFLEPRIYLNSTENFTIAMGLALLNSRFTTDFQGIMAQTVISLIPVLLVFFFMQRHYVQGVVISGVKG